MFRAVYLVSYAVDGLVMVVDLTLIAECGEDVRTVLNGDEPELEVEVEVVNVIGFDVIPSLETVSEKSSFESRKARQFDNQRDDRWRQAIVGRDERQSTDRILYCSSLRMWDMNLSA